MASAGGIIGYSLLKFNKENPLKTHAIASDGEDFRKSEAHPLNTYAIASSVVAFFCIALVAGAQISLHITLKNDEATSKGYSDEVSESVTARRKLQFDHMVECSAFDLKINSRRKELKLDPLPFNVICPFEISPAAVF